MSTILVADDNSNIQKMVGLALKDQGIEVVAVGNGEAAVRRIPDVNPDLVLADVFMPVKNGYEVCEFVKKDKRFSHIPVILLVGAFDPLDEHEAQRVGADGVLKKPFVPPDPLISMVKSALSRSAAESGRPRPIPKRVAALLAAASIPKVDAAPAVPAPLVAAGFKAGASKPEPQQEELGIPPRTESVTFSDGEKPLAFGSLLETRAKEPTVTEPEAPAEEYVAPVPHPGLSDSRNWGTPPAEEETEEEEEQKASWRRDAPDGEESIAAASSTGAVKDWRDFDEPDQAAPAHTEAAPAKDEPKASPSVFLAPGPASERDVIQDDHSAGGNSHATEAESFFVSHAEQEEIDEPLSSKENADASKVEAEQAKDFETVFRPEAYPGLFVEEKAPTKLSMQDDSADSSSAFGEISIIEDDQPVAPAEVKDEDRASAASETDAPARNLWEKQVREAARSVAASWPSLQTGAEFAAPSVAPTQPFQVETAATKTPATPEPDFHAPVIHEEQAWEEEHALAAEVQTEVFTPQEVSPEQPAHAVAPEAVSEIPGPASAAPAAPLAAADIEAIVARVLERMDPSIFQSLTQQLLKPVVEAIVRSELEKKK